jgi:predicted porin
MWADNGEDSDFFVADNDNSSTRFRFTGSEKFDKVKVGFKIELEAQRNPSHKLDIPNTGDGSGFNIDDRWLEASFDTNFGKISLGKGDGAANNTSESDLSGTKVIMYPSANVTAGGFSFVNSATREKSNTQIGDTRNNFDGLSRNDRVRYDTPSFGGFKLSTSVTNGNAWEVAGRYKNEIGGHKFLVSAGYVDTEDRGSSEYSQLGASAAWLSPFGLNLMVAYGNRDYSGSTEADRLADGKTEDATNYYAKLGYRWGIHAIAVEYGITKDLDEKDDDSSNYGLAYVIAPWKGVELFAAGYVYSLDRNNVEFEDINQIMTGTRIKF